MRARPRHRRQRRRVTPRPCCGRAPARVPPPAGAWIPKDTIFVLEVSNPKPILNLAFSPQMLTRIQQLPAYQRHSANVEFKQMQHLIGFLEATFDTDWKTGLGTLLGGGITLAVAPKDAVILIIDTEDPRMLQRLHEIFLNIRARGHFVSLWTGFLQ